MPSPATPGPGMPGPEMSRPAVPSPATPRPVTVLVGGEVTASVKVLGEPLSLWGGFDSATGRIIDRHHPQFGDSLTALAVCLPASRGSSSASSVLAEAVRSGTAPAALLLRSPDPILLLGALVAFELYGRGPTVVLLGDAPPPPDGSLVTVGASTLLEQPPPDQSFPAR